MKIADVNNFLERYPQYELIFEFVRGTKHNVAYVRFIPKNRMTPSQAQLMARLEFGLTSYGAYGKKGFEEIDGRMFPVVAATVKRRMKGKKFAKTVLLVDSPSFLSKVKRRFRRGMTQDPEKHRIKKLKRLAYAQEELRSQGKPSRIPVAIKKPEKKEPPSLTYAQVEAQAKMLARIYARDREIWNARERAGREERVRKLRNRR